MEAPMFAHALMAFVLLPGMVAIVVPIAWLVLSAHTVLQQPLGLLPLAAGLTGLLWCVRDFHVWGHGTLAPWQPPRQLVVVGLYRYSRNPMYLSVVMILLGWALAFGSSGLAVYALVIAVIFHLRVLLYEEPWLAHTFGADWEAYRADVPRWFL
jgi:protein-S-isoprenylcysteine O-methyltransferase Ste14